MIRFKFIKDMLSKEIIKESHLFLIDFSGNPPLKEDDFETILAMLNKYPNTHFSLISLSKADIHLLKEKEKIKDMLERISVIDKGDEFPIKDYDN